MPTTTQFVFANNVSTTIAATLTSTATTITLASSANFPTIPAGSTWAVTLNDRATQAIFEIVYVIAPPSGANLTVLRGQEGTAARAWSVGDYAYAADTAGVLNTFVDQTYLNGFLGIFNPRSYGALGNAVTNDAAAFTAANTAASAINIFGGQLYVGPGTYIIGSNVVITNPIVIANGAILYTTGSATITFSFTPEAGRYPIFGGTALTSAAVLMATSSASTPALDPLFPEWWGAAANNTSHDSGPPFQRAANALANSSGSAVLLGDGNYYVLTPASFLGISNHLFAGAGIGATTLTFSAAFTASEILSFGGVSSGSLAVNITLRDFAIAWTGSSSVSANVLQLQYGSDAIVRNVKMTCPSTNTNPIAALAGNGWTGCEVDTLLTRGAWNVGLLVGASPQWTYSDCDFRADTTVAGSAAVSGTASNHLIGTGNRVYGSGSAYWAIGFAPGTGSDYYHFANNDNNAAQPYLVDVSQTHGYIDYQSGTWVPADASGTGLTITNNETATWTKSGHNVTISLDITYQSTSSAVNANITLPYSPIGTTFFPLAVGFSTTPMLVVAVAGGVGVGNGIVFYQSHTVTEATNANMSAGRISISGTYQSTN